MVSEALYQKRELTLNRRQTALQRYYGLMPTDKRDYFAIF